MNFEPISYDHAARLIGKSPWNVSRDAGLLASAHLEAMQTYGRNQCIVGIDIYNVEIEAYGCEITAPDANGMPVAGKPILNDIGDFLPLRFDPVRDGRMPMILQAAQGIRAARPEAEIRIPLSGPFTIACHLFGMENMICELATNPEPATAALMHLAENQLLFARAALEKGFAIALFESAVTPPLLSPKLFADNVLPALHKTLSGLKRGAHPGTQMIIGGDTIRILDAILSLSPSYIICPVETDQEKFMTRIPNRQPVDIRINMNPAVFLPDRREAAMVEARRACAIAKRHPRTSVGTIVPFDADPAIVREVARFIESQPPGNTAILILA